MANRRKDVPPGWRWRDGRPRWEPSPTLRRAGWKGRDLRDARGAFLAKGPSIERAEEIWAAVEAWRRGEPVGGEAAAVAPDGAAAGRPFVAGAADPLSIGALIDDYLASDQLLYTRAGHPRSPKTVSDYRSKLKRLVDALAGYAVLPEPPALPPAARAARTRKARAEALAGLHASPEWRAHQAALARYEAAVAQVRALSVFTLEPAEATDAAGRPVVMAPLYDAYWKLSRHAGRNMAYGTMAAASAWLGWCRRFRSGRIANWTADVQRETPRGRIVTYAWAEVAHLVRTAEAMGRAWVADAVVLALDLSWSEADVLNLTWDRVRDGRAFPANPRTGEEGRAKTGRRGGTPLLSLGRARLEAIRRRNEADGVSSLRVVRIARARNRRARPLADDADGHYLRKEFAKVRARAAETMPGLKDKTFADLRDTAFTWGKEAGLSKEELSSRTLQSLKNLDQLSDAHYGEIGPDIADAAVAKLEAVYEKKGVRL